MKHPERRYSSQHHATVRARARRREPAPGPSGRERRWQRRATRRTAPMTVPPRMGPRLTSLCMPERRRGCPDADAQRHRAAGAHSPPSLDARMPRAPSSTQPIVSGVNARRPTWARAAATYGGRRELAGPTLAACGQLPQAVSGLRASPRHFPPAGPRRGKTNGAPGPGPPSVRRAARRGRPVAPRTAASRFRLIRAASTLATLATGMLGAFHVKRSAAVGPRGDRSATNTAISLVHGAGGSARPLRSHVKPSRAVVRHHERGRVDRGTRQAARPSRTRRAAPRPGRPWAAPSIYFDLPRADISRRPHALAHDPPGTRISQLAPCRGAHPGMSSGDRHASRSRRPPRAPSV